jgi:hypothetical protein
MLRPGCGGQLPPPTFLLPIRYLHLEQRGAERLAVRIERQRSRHAAAERLVEHEIERADRGQFVALDAAFDGIREMRLHALGGDMLGQERVVARFVRDGPERKRLQSKAGYIDARPHIRQPEEVFLQRTAGPYIWVKSRQNVLLGLCPLYPQKRTSDLRG